MRSAVFVALAILALSPVACPKRAGEPDAGAARDRERERADLAVVARLERTRAPFDPTWERLAASRSPAVRAAVALALGRGAVEGGAPVLARLLADADASVRATAAFAIGCYEHRKVPGIRRAMLARLLEELDAEVIARIVLSYGRIGGRGAKAVLERALTHPIPRVREAAALGAGRLAASRADRPATLGPALRAALGRERDPEVRRALAFGLARIGISPPGDLFGDADSGVRYFAVSAWERSYVPGRDPAPLRARLADDDWRVRVVALRALSRAGAAEEIARALQSAWLTFAASHDHLRSERVQVVLAALEALAPLLPAGRERIEEIHGSSDVRESVIRYRPEALTSIDAVNCAAARILDELDGAPDRVHRCGEPGVPEWRRKRLAAQVLARTTASPPAERIDRLAPLVRDPDPRVRAAAAEALNALWDAPGARSLVLAALRSRDAGVLGALAETIANRAGRDPQLEEALLAAAPFLRSGRDAEAMVSMARALGAVGSPKSAPRLLELVADPVLAVSEAARASFVRLYPSDPPPPAARRAFSDLPAPAAPGAKLVATVETTKGPFEIALDAETAPLTVGSFADLARRGFFDRQLVHRVVPAFVTQMGDPRGDGSGGPGYSLPCELGPGRFRRGSVGMALAGRDTGGSQFFISHIDAPHLDGAYPQFGTVTKGMEVVEALVEGDSILKVTVRQQP